jgi:hypothetical protein
LTESKWELSPSQTVIEVPPPTSLQLSPYQWRYIVSLRIDIDTIARLLLQDGMWYEVLPGSFTVDSFEWTDSDGRIADSGSIAGAPPLGVRFKVRGMNGWISCPLKSVIAVHYEPIEIEEPIPMNIPKALAEEIGPNPR